jgi:hypothetical protein
MKNKVPQITFAFWLIKIAATTLGETGGDALSGKQRTMIWEDKNGQKEIGARC